MNVFDTFLADIIAFVDANPEYKLVVASSMGQASTEAKPLYSQTYLKDAKLFFSRLGLNDGDYEHVPAMFPQYNIRVNVTKVAAFLARLSTLIIDNEKLDFREADNGFVAINLGHPNVTDQWVTLDGRTIPFAELGLFNMVIEDQSATTAYHVPEGSMIVYDPRNRAPKTGVTTIPSTVVAPNILKNFHEYSVLHELREDGMVGHMMAVLLSCRKALADSKGVMTFIWTNPGNRGQRLRRTLRGIGWQVTKRLANKTRPLVLANGARMQVHPDCVVSSALIYTDWPEYHELAFIRERLRSTDVVIDVGANVGHILLLVSDIVEPGHLFAFEPTPVSFLRLKANCPRWCPNPAHLAIGSAGQAPHLSQIPPDNLTRCG
jgi:hypothetical protein